MTPTTEQEKLATQLRGYVDLAQGPTAAAAKLLQADDVELWQQGIDLAFQAALSAPPSLARLIEEEALLLHEALPPQAGCDCEHCEVVRD